MRPIEFRGLRTDGKGWAYGDLLHPHQGNSSTFIAYYNGHITEVNPSTVGQFTGLYDKNGVKVFEGDTTKFGFEVVYVNTSFMLKKESSYIDLSFPTGVTVTGNIHEPATVRE